MGTTLTGTTPQDTYDSLIKVTDNGPLSGTAKYLSDGLGNDSALALSTSGVGIGTTSLSAALDIRKDSGVYEVVRIQNASAGALYRAVGLGGGSVDFGADDTLASTALFRTAGSERMRINSTGQVGINVSSNSGGALVHIGAANGTTYAANAQLRISGKGTNNNVAQIVLSDDALSDAKISYFPSAAAAGQLLSLSARSTQTDFQITGDGYVRLGSGMGGIQFNSDTAAANALDDYEEGTWTMGISFGGASVGVTYSANSGTYTKIGRQVTVNGLIILSSKGSSAGSAAITGLPFTVPNDNANYSAASLKFNNLTFANQYQGFARINTTTIDLEEITELGAVSFIADTDFANNTVIVVGLTYFV